MKPRERTPFGHTGHRGKNCSLFPRPAQRQGTSHHRLRRLMIARRAKCTGRDPNLRAECQRAPSRAGSQRSIPLRELGKGSHWVDMQGPHVSTRSTEKLGYMAASTVKHFGSTRWKRTKSAGLQQTDFTGRAVKTHK